MVCWGCALKKLSASGLLATCEKDFLAYLFDQDAGASPLFPLAGLSYQQAKEQIEEILHQGVTVFGDTFAQEECNWWNGW